MSKRKITWTKRATLQFSAAIDYIRKDSDQNAGIVKLRILSKIGEIANGRVIHRRDPYKKNNDGNYLFIEILKYRIV